MIIWTITQIYPTSYLKDRTELKCAYILKVYVGGLCNMIDTWSTDVQFVSVFTKI